MHQVQTKSSNSANGIKKNDKNDPLIDAANDNADIGDAQSSDESIAFSQSNTNGDRDNPPIDGNHKSDIGDAQSSDEGIQFSQWNTNDDRDDPANHNADIPVWDVPSSDESIKFSQLNDNVDIDNPPIDDNHNAAIWDAPSSDENIKFSQSNTNGDRDSPIPSNDTHQENMYIKADHKDCHESANYVSGDEETVPNTPTKFSIYLTKDE